MSSVLSNHILSNLLIRMPNWLGDCIMAYPTIRLLAQHGLQITLFGRPWLADLYNFILPVVRSASLGNDFWSARQALMHNDTKNLILLTNSFSSVWQAYCANKYSVGYKGDFRKYLLRHAVTRPNNILHEVEFFWYITNEALKYWDLGQLPLLKDTLETVKVSPVTVPCKLPEKFIVICPFAVGVSKTGEKKIWPFWSEFIKKLAKDFNIVICPGPQERFDDYKKTENIFIINNTNIKQLAYIISLADLTIANDSGPLHLANLINKNVIGLFGVTDPNKTRPWGGHYLGNLGHWPSLDEVLSLALTMCSIPIITDPNINN